MCVCVCVCVCVLDKKFSLRETFTMSVNISYTSDVLEHKMASEPA